MTTPAVRKGAYQIYFLTAFAIIATAGMWLNLMYYSWFAGPLGWTFPNDTFQMVQVSRFSDFYNMVELAKTRDPYNTTHRPPPPPPKMLRSGYPPLMNAVAYAFSRFYIDFSETGTAGVRKGQDPAIWIFMAIPFIGFPILTLYWLKSDTPWLTGFLVCCGFNLSYPMLFSLDRGNLELLVYPLITIYAWLANSASPGQRWIALVSICIAASFKIYPLIFILVYLKQRRWREAAWMVVLTATITLLSYFAFEGSIAENMKANISALNDVRVWMVTNVGWATTHSSGLFSLIFLAVKYVFHYEPGVRWVLANYSRALELFALISGLAMAFRSLSFGRLLAATCCVAILATPESPDYKLLLLFPAVIAIIAEGGGGRIFNLLFVSFFGLLLVAKNWIIIVDDVTYGSIFNPLLVLALLALVLMSPAPSGTPVFGFPFPALCRKARDLVRGRIRTQA